jgi:hypothetical protein
MRLCRFFVVVAVLAGCGVSKPSQNELEMVLLQQELRFSAVIDKIEKYRTENGHYPSDLQAVSDVAFTSVDLPAQFKTLRTAPAHYEVARDRSFFRVTYGISDAEDYELHASSSYLSFENRWNIGHHVERFPHVEAKYFGARYQQGHSSESLSLTITSLLEAATANSAYPCRNLWADWIEKALGAGAPQHLGSPSLPVVGETKFYTTRDNKAAYAVVIDRKIFSPMKTPLPFVVGIFEWRLENTAWAVVQRCDSSS